MPFWIGPWPETKMFPFMALSGDSLQTSVTYKCDLRWQSVNHLTPLCLQCLWRIWSAWLPASGMQSSRGVDKLDKLCSLESVKKASTLLHILCELHLRWCLSVDSGGVCVSGDMACGWCMWDLGWSFKGRNVEEGSERCNILKLPRNIASNPLAMFFFHSAEKLPGCECDILSRQIFKYGLHSFSGLENNGILRGERVVWF